MKGLGRLAGPTALVLALLVAGCNRPQPANPDWIIRAPLVFLTEDLGAQRPPLPKSDFRLFFPFVCGDIYGQPTTGDYLDPMLSAGNVLEVDLNKAHAGLLASLEPTQFSLPYLRIEPANARIARLEPMVLQRDGIELVGRAEWFDPQTKRTLLLLYLDRPATIAGRGSAYGKRVRYRIRAPAAGYFWVAPIPGAAEDVYEIVARPPGLQMAVLPPPPAVNDRATHN